MDLRLFVGVLKPRAGVVRRLPSQGQQQAFRQPLGPGVRQQRPAADSGQQQFQLPIHQHGLAEQLDQQAIFQKRFAGAWILRRGRDHGVMLLAQRRRGNQGQILMLDRRTVEQPPQTRVERGLIPQGLGPPKNLGQPGLAVCGIGTQGQRGLIGLHRLIELATLIAELSQSLVGFEKLRRQLAGLSKSQRGVTELTLLLKTNALIEGRYRARTGRHGHSCFGLLGGEPSFPAVHNFCWVPWKWKERFGRS